MFHKHFLWFHRILFYLNIMINYEHTRKMLCWDISQVKSFRVKNRIVVHGLLKTKS